MVVGESNKSVVGRERGGSDEAGGSGAWSVPRREVGDRKTREGCS